MQVGRTTAACVLVILAGASRVHAQEPLAAARQLYASAEYENALGVLDGLTAATYTREDRQAIELYRALCLLAVGRRVDADHAIEAMVTQDPLYRPADDLSPRMRTAFSDARKRMLPSIVQQHYNEAKSAFDRKEFAAAVSGFKRVMDVLSDPDMAQAASQPPLSDVRTLASGFHDLSLKAIPPLIQVEPAPVVALAPRIHVAEDRNVVPPVAIKQELPRFPEVVRAGIKGVLEIVIGETGIVESATIMAPTTASYDRMVLAAANTWLYYPATIDRKPVKFRKRIQINISAP